MISAAPPIGETRHARRVPPGVAGLERMHGGFLPSRSEYFAQYGLTPQRLKLAKPDAIVMHPGPTNRGVEIEASVADGGHSVILQQVTYGIAVRMAIMSMIMGQQHA